MEVSLKNSINGLKLKMAFLKKDSNVCRVSRPVTSFCYCFWTGRIENGRNYSSESHKRKSAYLIQNVVLIPSLAFFSYICYYFVEKNST